ncbi:MAG TPA: ABC transporter transmembrane domain-containing protein, partial [Gammaproteobacteria bacterium]
MSDAFAPTSSAQWRSHPARVEVDPLAECLAVLTRRENRPVSPESLCAGLPLIDGRLTPELFVRAAERAGFSARVVRRPLADISTLVLPAVLLLNHRDACLLTALPDGGRSTIVQPEAPDSETTLDRAELECAYSGYAIFVRPLAKTPGAPGQRRAGTAGHWFLDTIARTRTLYMEVVVASLLINLFALGSPLFVMNVYDRVVPNAAVETLWVLAIGVAIVYVFDFVMKTLRTYFVDAAGKHADVLMSSSIFDHVMDLQLVARPGSVGSFANQLQEFESFRDFFTSATLATVIDLPFIVIFLLVIYAIGGPVVWTPIAAIPVVIGIGLLVQLPLRRLIEQTFRAATQKHSVLIEMLSGLESVKTLRAQGNLQRQWEAQVGHLARLGQ